MATKSWQSVSSTDWATAGNWNGGVPTSNDHAIVNGGVSIAGYDASAVDLDSLNIGPDFTGAIGSTGSYLIVAGDLVNIKTTTQASIRGARDIYLDTGGTYTSDVVYIDSTAVNQTIYLKGTITDLMVNHGRVVLVSGTVAELHVVWDGTGTAPTVEIQTPTITLANVHRYGGTVRMTQAGTVTTTRQNGGDFEATAGTLTNAYVSGGALRDTTTTTTTLLHIYPGGRVDYRSNVAGKTVTTTEVYGSGELLYDKELVRITFTNAPVERLRTTVYATPFLIG